MIARRLRQGKDVAGIVHLVRYITAPQGKNHRVGEVFISNCISVTPMMAAREMLIKQLLNTRAKSDKSYHMLVSFKLGEEPSKEILRKIEGALCARLGFGEHQRVAAVHRDTDHVHMHIAINKIHPKKLTIHSPYYDFDALAKACVEIEQKLDIGKDNHQPTGKTRGERQAGDVEALTGNESLHTWIHREVFEKLKAAESWGALHSELARAGLTLSLRGAGVVVTSDSGHRITGGGIHRSFSKLHLEQRLGKFQSKPEWCSGIKLEKQYLRDPQAAPDNPLRREYETLRDAGDEARDLRLGAIDLEYTKRKEAILAENVADRAKARATPIGRFPKRQLYAAIHGKYRSQLELLMAETKRSRKEVHGTYPSQSWVQWLQEQAKAGRTEAVEALRKRAFSLARKNGAALRGGEQEKPGAPEILPEQKIDNVTKLGTVIYDLGADAVRDDGESFRISAGATTETDVMALKMAQRRFGNVVFVDGDHAFRERMIRAAVEGKVFIKFGDPMMEHKRNELFRIRYQEREERERSRAEHEHIPTTLVSGLTAGLTTEEVRDIFANTTRKSARGDGHARGGRLENGHPAVGRADIDRAPAASASGLTVGLTSKEVREIFANTTSEPARGDGYAKGGGQENGHPAAGRPDPGHAPAVPASGLTMGLTAEEVRDILANTTRKPDRDDGYTKGGRRENGHPSVGRADLDRAPPALASGLTAGLTAKEVREILANTTRKPVGSDGHARDGRPENRHSAAGRSDPGSAPAAPASGLTSEELREIIAKATRRPARDDGRAEGGRPENGHGRGEENTRGQSLSTAKERNMGIHERNQDRRRGIASGRARMGDAGAPGKNH